jgi:hypothetical protein
MVEVARSRRPAPFRLVLGALKAHRIACGRSSCTPERQPPTLVSPAQGNSSRFSPTSGLQQVAYNSVVRRAFHLLRTTAGIRCDTGNIHPMTHLLQSTSFLAIRPQAATHSCVTRSGAVCAEHGHSGVVVRRGSSVPGLHAPRPKNRPTHQPGRDHRDRHGGGLRQQP